jgi:hypothetical protein
MGTANAIMSSEGTANMMAADVANCWNGMPLCFSACLTSSAKRSRCSGGSWEMGIFARAPAQVANSAPSIPSTIMRLLARLAGRSSSASGAGP